MIKDRLVRLWFWFYLFYAFADWGQGLSGADIGVGVGDSIGAHGSPPNPPPYP